MGGTDQFACPYACAAIATTTAATSTRCYPRTTKACAAMRGMVGSSHPLVAAGSCCCCCCSSLLLLLLLLSSFFVRSRPSMWPDAALSASLTCFCCRSVVQQVHGKGIGQGKCGVAQ